MLYMISLPIIPRRKTRWRLVHLPINRSERKRLFLVSKSLNGLIDWNFTFNHFKDMHDYNTRFNNNICKPQSKRSWGQHRFVCHAVDDWNALPDGIKNISDFLVFRRLIRIM